MPFIRLLNVVIYSSPASSLSFSFRYRPPLSSGLVFYRKKGHGQLAPGDCEIEKSKQTKANETWPMKSSLSLTLVISAISHTSCLLWQTNFHRIRYTRASVNRLLPPYRTFVRPPLHHLLSLGTMAQTRENIIDGKPRHR